MTLWTGQSASLFRYTGVTKLLTQLIAEAVLNVAICYVLKTQD
jgi:hypothetical protein